MKICYWSSMTIFQSSNAKVLAHDTPKPKNRNAPTNSRPVILQCFTMSRCGSIIDCTSGETNYAAGKSTRKKVILWVTDLRNRIKRNPHKNNPRPRAPARRKSRPSPPRKPAAKRSNQQARPVSPETPSGEADSSFGNPHLSSSSEEDWVKRITTFPLPVLETVSLPKHMQTTRRKAKPGKKKAACLSYPELELEPGAETNPQATIRQRLAETQARNRHQRIPRRKP